MFSAIFLFKTWVLNQSTSVRSSINVSHLQWDESSSEGVFQNLSTFFKQDIFLQNMDIKEAS